MIPHCLDDAVPLLPVVSLLLVRHAAGREHLGQTPVNYLHFTERPDHDVRRLQIAMNHAPRVRVRHRLTDLLEDAQKPGPFLAGVLAIFQQPGQRLTLDQLHAEKRPLVRELAQLVDRSDPWML